MTFPDLEPASRREMVLLVVYLMSVVAAAELLNFRAGFEVMTIALVVAAAARGMLVPFIRDWWFYLLGLLLWGLGGPILSDSPFPVHHRFMPTLDGLMSFGHSPVALLQGALSTPDRVTPIDVITLAVYKCHVPEPFIVGYLLWRLDRLTYYLFAAAVLVLLIITFVSFAVVPAIPPWVAAEWYHEVPGIVNRAAIAQRAYPVRYHSWFDIGAVPWTVSAAFPSQHAAFPVIEYLAARTLRRTLAHVVLLWVAVVSFSVVYLGEHWVSDVLAGWIYAGLAFLFVQRFCRAAGHRG